MKLNLITLCSVCCALLYGDVLAEPKCEGASTEWTAAAESGNLEAMEQIYDNCFGKKLEFSDNSMGRAALEAAVEKGHCNVVEWLDSIIRKRENDMGGHQFNLRSENKDGKPMMIVAVENGHEDIVKYMLSKAMDPDIYTDNISRNYRTPLMVAAENGFKDIANLLLTGKGYRKADPNKQDRHGRTALVYAVKKGNAGVVELLLEHGADTEIKDESKRTALMYAVENGDLDIAKLLLDYDAKINRTGENKKTVVDYAEGNEEMIKLLTKYSRRPENQKKVNALKRVWNKVTNKGDKNLSADSEATLNGDDTETGQDIDDLISSTDTLVGE
ncbi:MAG: ankyrin repeat domain-containing protein [Alphaproteobacteria bacterium]|nr:ankyrin repeat domain-containing protein [Alphaproteobacteria bacterium]